MEHKPYQSGTVPTTSALVCAIETGRVHLMPLLLQYGANVEGKEGYWGDRPLHRAAGKGNITAIDTLIGAGARKGVRDRRQRTVFHCAAAEGRSEVIPRLSSLGFYIHARDEQGQTPLHLAQYEGCGKTYQVLVSHGADPEAKDDQGKSVAQCHAEEVEKYPSRWWGA